MTEKLESLLAQAHDALSAAKNEQGYFWEDELSDRVRDVQKRIREALGLEPGPVSLQGLQPSAQGGSILAGSHEGDQVADGRPEIGIGSDVVGVTFNDVPSSKAEFNVHAGHGTPPSMETERAGIARCVRVKYKKEDGWHIFHSDEMPGLYVASPEFEKAFCDVSPSIKLLRELNGEASIPEPTWHMAIS